MDRLSQAEALLAAVSARSPLVVVPGRAPSPMDCSTTIPVARSLIDACDRAATGGEVIDPEMARAASGLNPPSANSRPA